MLMRIKLRFELGVLGFRSSDGLLRENGKKMDTEALVQYAFGNDQGFGLLELNKGNGEVLLLDPMPGDKDQHFFVRAMVKIIREWNSGSLPEIIEWAS